MGEVFAGRYELVDVLDAGGVGTVWRAWDHREGSYRAAKVLRQSDSDSLLRFVRETSHRIDHPHVVTPLGWAGEDDRVLFTMPLVHGGSLATLVDDFGALPVGWAVELLRQSLTALEAVHAVGLVHRDVKPGNLLFHDTGSGRPHLLLSDFGAAAQVSAPRLTRSDSVIGTPGYFAPEQIRGADPDPLQDVYAVAVVTLQTVTGQPPTSAGDLPTYLPRTALERALADLVKEMTVAEPGHRTPGAGAARAKLDAIEGSDDYRAGADPLSPVEVFDHVPPLPEGWDTHGPAGAVGEVLPARPSTPAARPRVPAAAWVRAAIGVALIAVAVSLER